MVRVRDYRGVWGVAVDSLSLSVSQSRPSKKARVRVQDYRGVWGVGCGVWGVGCGVWGVRCGVWRWTHCLSACPSRDHQRRLGLGCRTTGGCGVWGVGCGVWGVGCGV